MIKGFYEHLSASSACRKAYRCAEAEKIASKPGNGRPDGSGNALLAAGQRSLGPRSRWEEAESDAGSCLRAQHLCTGKEKCCV